MPTHKQDPITSSQSSCSLGSRNMFVTFISQVSELHKTKNSFTQIYSKILFQKQLLKCCLHTNTHTDFYLWSRKDSLPHSTQLPQLVSTSDFHMCLHRQAFPYMECYIYYTQTTTNVKRTILNGVIAYIIC